MIACLIALPAIQLRAQESSDRQSDQSDARTDLAIGSGLAFLARQQGDDGSFEGGGPSIAVAGLTLMAFLSTGQTQDVGRYGLTVRRTVDFLLKSQPADGYFGRVDGSRMYGQGIATLALAECFGVESDPQQRTRIKTAVQRGVDVILRAQQLPKNPSAAGGWRYEPQSTDSDLSLSGWCILALLAARDIGIDVPQQSLDRAADYVLRCYQPDRRAFAYQPQGEVSKAMTAVGVLTVGLLDSPTRPEAASAASTLPLDAQTNGTLRYQCYTIYYTTQAALMAGDPVWQQTWPTTRDLLLSLHSKDGGWPPSTSSEEPGRTYSTSLAILTLAAPMRVLPVYHTNP